jgi:hypothetical protein
MIKNHGCRPEFPLVWHILELPQVMYPLAQDLGIMEKSWKSWGDMDEQWKHG